MTIKKMIFPRGWCSLNRTVPDYFPSGTISGNINAEGEINAAGSAGFSKWSGQIKSIDGRLSGSGTWTGYGGSGS